MNLGKCTVYVDPFNLENPHYPVGLTSRLCKCVVTFSESAQTLILASCEEINESLILHSFRQGGLFSHDSDRAVNLTVQRNSDSNSMVRFICAVPKSAQGSMLSFTCYKRTFQGKLVHYANG